MERTSNQQMAEARGELVAALRDWKDAGGSIITVMGAIERYVMASIDSRRAKCVVCDGNPPTDAPCTGCGRQSQPRAAEKDETKVTFAACPYCTRPADSEGGILHVAGCAALETVYMTRLQYDALVSRPVEKTGTEP